MLDRITGDRGTRDHQFIPRSRAPRRLRSPWQRLNPVKSFNWTHHGNKPKRKMAETLYMSSMANAMETLIGFHHYFERNSHLPLSSIFAGGGTFSLGSGTFAFLPKANGAWHCIDSWRIGTKDFLADCPRNPPPPPGGFRPLGPKMAAG